MTVSNTTVSREKERLDEVEVRITNAINAVFMDAGLRVETLNKFTE